MGLSTAPGQAQNAYIPNMVSNNVTVIDTQSNKVIATIPVGTQPYGVAVTPDGSTVYVTNQFSDTVSVIATASNTVTATIEVGTSPTGVAVTPDGSTVYVANFGSDDVSVIATASNTVTATISGIPSAYGVAVTPEGSAVYVTSSENSGIVYEILTASNTIDDTIPVGGGPEGVAVTPDYADGHWGDWGPTFQAAIDASGAISTVTPAQQGFPAPTVSGVFPHLEIGAPAGIPGARCSGSVDLVRAK